MEGSTGQSAPEQAKEKVQQAAGQAQEQARNVSQQARGRVADVVGQRTTDAGDQVNSAAQALRQTSSQLRSQGTAAPAASAMESVAERIEGLGNWLRDSDGDKILHDIEDLGRRQPTAILVGGLAIGFAASRLLKASSTKRYQSRSGSLDRYRTMGARGLESGGASNPAHAGMGVGTAPDAPGALSGSPTSGLTAEGGTASAPTSRMGLETDVRDADARREAATRPDSSPTGGV